MYRCAGTAGVALHFNMYAGIVDDDGNCIIKFRIKLGFDVVFIIVEFYSNNPAAKLINVSAFRGVWAFILAVDSEHPTWFLRVPSECGQASIWHVQDIALGQGVCGALVTDKDIVGVRLIDFAS